MVTAATAAVVYICSMFCVLLLALWRLVLVLSIVYELFLVFLLFQVSWYSCNIFFVKVQLLKLISC